MRVLIVQTINEQTQKVIDKTLIALEYGRTVGSCHSLTPHCWARFFVNSPDIKLLIWDIACHYLVVSFSYSDLLMLHPNFNNGDFMQTTSSTKKISFNMYQHVCLCAITYVFLIPFDTCILLLFMYV